MNSLITTVCDMHTPHIPSISTVWNSSDSSDSYTFCESCEQNITRFGFYDDERGMIHSNWKVGK
jgi:hypothetical protein